MGLEIKVDGDRLTLLINGWDRVWAWRRQVDINLDDIDAVSVQDKQPLVDRLAVRLGGSSIPGYLVAGNYSVWPHARQEKGDREFWLTHRANEVLVIDLSIGRPRRVVLETDDSRGWVRQLQDRLDEREG